MEEKTIATIETITDAQIGRISDRFKEKCRKNVASLPKDATQQVIEDEGDQLAQEMFETLRKRVEARSGMIVRRVKVNRKQSPKQAIDATGRVKYINDDVLANMPGEGAEEVDVYFFNLRKNVSVDDLDREYERRGLAPDPYAQAQVNADDPAFADAHPNATQWDNKNRHASYSAFCRLDVERIVSVSRGGNGWSDRWWFGGVRKSRTLGN
ncbi:MAG: hypothetical protein ABIJ81_02695 [Patescibacteria group bacterium]